MSSQGKIKISRWMKVYFSITNLLVVTILMADLFHLSGLGYMEPKNLALANLIVLAFSFISYRLKVKFKSSKNEKGSV